MPNYVTIGFEKLLSDFDLLVDELNQRGAQKFSIADYETTKELLATVDIVEEMKEKVLTLKEEWSNLEIETGPQLTSDHKPIPIGKSKPKVRVRQGIKTRQEEFTYPILSALASLGGSAHYSTILDRVYPMVKEKLNEHDLDSLPSDPNSVRWKNTAQWEKSKMKQQGLIQDGHARGIWDITAKGRKLLGDNDVPVDLFGSKDELSVQN